MSVQQQPQGSLSPSSDVQDRFLHLKSIDIEFAGNRPDSNLEIKFKDELGFKYKSAVFNERGSLHWECDIYVKSLTKSVLTVQKPFGIHRKRQVAEFCLAFDSAEYGDNKVIERTDQKSDIVSKLSFGESKPSSEVTSLLADKAVSALATKVAMLDKFDQILKYLNLVLKLGSDAAQLNSAAQATVPIVTAAFKKFQEVSACHRDLVFIMGDLVSVLPVLKLALERVTDVEVRGLLQNFVELVKHLSQELIQYSSGSTLGFLSQNWYNSKKDDVTKLKDQIVQLKLNVGLGLDVDIKGGVSEIQAGVLEMQADVSEIQAGVSEIQVGVPQIQAGVTEIRQHQLSEEDKMALDRLRPPEYCTYDPSRCCLPGTRVPLLRNVEQWAPSEGHSSRLYWIHGVAGCGKSSVAASVASALESRKLLSGSFFCKRDIPERRDPIRLVRALTYFLARASSLFSKVLLRVRKEDAIVLDKPFLAQFKALLLGPLSEVSQTSHPGPIIIIVDALDECDDNKTMPKCLKDMVKAAPWLRLIVTSRPIPYISDGLCDSEGLVESCNLFEADTRADILSFIRVQFSSDGPLKELEAHVSEIQIENLMRKARGLFIWITTVLSYVSGLLTGKLKAIKEIISSTPASNPEGELDTLYLRVLDSVTGSSSANKTTVRMLVGLIFATSRNRPLPAKALHAFLPSDMEILPEELEGMLGRLGSVVTTDSQTNTVRVCHPSFLDFIGSQTRSGDFWTETATLETIMAHKCFQIMKGGLKFNICELETSYIRNNDVENLEERVDRCISREVQYSCFYWLSHLSKSELDFCGETVRQMLRGFLCQTTSLYWLEVMSLMSELKTAGTILQKFIDIYKDDADLFSAASDLYRFVKAFHEPMSCSTPHIYISALLWSPSESTTAKQLVPNFISGQCVLRGRNKYWPINLQTLILSSVVCCVAYSPDGTRIVSGSNDSTVRIWDAQSGTQVGEPLKGHNHSVWSVAYSPDGIRIVSGSFDKTIRIWDVQSGTQVGEPLKGHNDVVLSIAYSPDGTRIVSGSEDSTIRIWDAESGTQIGEPLQGHKGAVSSVAYSPDGTRIVSGSDDGTIRIWDAESGTQIRIWDAQSGTQVGKLLKGHNNTVWSVAYSPDGTRIISGSDDKTIRIWDAENGTQVGEPLKGHNHSVWSVAYSPDGTRIVSGSFDKTIRIWDAESGSQVGEPFKGHNAKVLSIAYSPDRTRIVSGSDDKTIRIWDAESGTQVGKPPEGHNAKVLSIAYFPDGTRIVSGSEDSTIRIWDAQNGTQVSEPLNGHSSTVDSVVYSPDGTRLVSGSFDKMIRIWDAESGTQVGEPLQGHKGAVSSVAYSPDGTRIVSGSDDKTIRIWDAESGIQVCEPLKGHNGTVWSVAYSPDGTRIVSGSDDKTIRVWDAESGSQVGEPLKGHHSAVWSVAYSPNGTRIVSGSFDKTIWIWDAESGTQIGEPLKGHNNWVRSVAYSPDGTRIVSGSDDKTIRIWDAESGTQVGEPLKGHNGWVYSVAYSRDGTRIVSGSDDGTIRIWAAQSGTQIGASLEGQSLWTVYSPDGKHFVSTSASKTSYDAQEKELIAYSEIPQSIANDGWIRTLDGGLLLWVPYEYRLGVCDMSLACLPHNADGHPVRIDWEKLCRASGRDWSGVKIDR